MQRITTRLLQPVDWQGAARCAEVDPEIFFPERGGSSKAARAVCAVCDVRAECLEYALNNKEQFGIWGGVVRGFVQSRGNPRGWSERRVG